MSTKGIRNFRPELHFTPREMWANDPNGLVFENGNYHLFYQYYPNDTVWGPMHWGHAVSKDLIHWEHLPIALYPDESGYIFSGSAVYDKDNTSGFGKDGKAAIVAMFTHHGKFEQQSIAYSIDGVNFTKYQNNPVIPNNQLKDFRDPKVFWNPIKDCWSAVISAGDRVHFYSSPDLKKWQKTGEFGPQDNFAKGVWECPDLFPLKTTKGEKWVLLVSMGMDVHDGGAKTQYFIGQFDGNTFVSDKNFDRAEFIDNGFDNYAGITYQNIEQRILIGWGINWRYASDIPTNEFCGLMTLPRILSLVDTPNDGLRLSSLPVGLDNYISGIKNLKSGDKIDDEVFKLHIEGEGAFEIRLINSANQTLIFGIDKDNRIYVDRSKGGAVSFNEIFASDLYSKTSEKRFYDGKYEIDAIFDVSILEIFADNGTRVFSQVVYPDTPYNTLQFTGNIRVTHMKLEKYRSSTVK